MAILLLGMSLASGCASSPVEPNQGEDTDLLYDGEAQVLYDAQQKAETSKQAMRYGERALQVGETDRALYQFVSAYELDPGQYIALHRVGLIQARKGNLDRASLAFRMALDIKPDHGETLIELGLVQLRLRRYVQARQYIEKALAGGIESWRAYNGLAVLADLNRDFETSEEYYRKALALNPDSPVLWNNQGYSRYLAGRRTEAKTSIAKALDFDNDYRKAWLNLGLIYVRDGYYEEALGAFERVMTNPDALERVGSLAMAEGKFDIAEHFLTRAIDESPSYHENAYEKIDVLETLRGREDDRDPDRKPKRSGWRILDNAGSTISRLND